MYKNVIPVSKENAVTSVYAQCGHYLSMWPLSLNVATISQCGPFLPSRNTFTEIELECVVVQQ